MVGSQCQNDQQNMTFQYQLASADFILETIQRTDTIKTPRKSFRFFKRIGRSSQI